MTETRVVHVRDPLGFDVYIGRSVPRRGLRGSIFANPFRIGQHGDRDEVIAKYRQRLLSRPDLLARLPELRGLRLGCWCASSGGVTARDPLVCHGQVLAGFADDIDLAEAEAPASAYRQQDA